VKNVFRHFCEIREKGREQVELSTNLLTGEPGSGKSYIIKTLRELKKLMNMGIMATTSYNGIVAVNVDVNTIQQMFPCKKIHTVTERP
jgi:nucleoside-triphosphatase THEP1